MQPRKQLYCVALNRVVQYIACILYTYTSTYKAPGWQQVTYSTSATKRGDTSSFQDTQEHRVLSQKFIEFQSSTSGHQPPNP